jgi:hypothetical protein
VPDDLTLRERSAFEPLAKPVKDELAAEAESLLRFLDDTGAAPRVAFAQR